MKVYKYRGIYDEKTFERDLNSIQKNNFWGANFQTLNDPCETIITSDTLTKQSKFILPIFGKNSKEKFKPVMDALNNLLSHTQKIGIYSLSKTYIDEILWAHYANSHNGYCIQYDFETLLKSYKSDKVYSFPVTYKKRPPSIDFDNIIKSSESNDLIQKMAGYKSIRWKYEEEIRIVTEDYGEHSYDYQAVKGIYFGLRMKEKHKNEIMKRLKGRGINYYQIEQISKTYKFTIKQVPDNYGNEITYLCKIPKSKKRQFEVNYKIIEKEFYKFNGKATITIMLDSKIEEKELTPIANTIKSDIFQKADRIFISFIIDGIANENGYWATARFEGENLTLSINGLNIEQEKLLVDGLKKEVRNPIGMWIDETPFVSSSMTLLEENGKIVLETKYFDGSKSTEKFESTQLKDNTRYDKSDANDHGEYFIIDKTGVLKYFSEDGLFKELKPFNRN
jgi:Protein of unknown function (DUF2971)